MVKLNVGCGNDIKEGYVNIDHIALDGVDVVHDLNVLPLPFESDSVDEILCLDVLEHIDYIPLLQDFHRILKKGGKIIVRTPHFSSRFNYIDPTHLNRFSIQTFEFFLSNSFFKREYYQTFSFSAIVHQKIAFEMSPFFPWNYFMAPIVNLSKSLQVYFEATFLCRLFPASNIHIELKK